MCRLNAYEKIVLAAVRNGIPAEREIDVATKQRASSRKCGFDDHAEIIIVEQVSMRDHVGGTHDVTRVVSDRAHAETHANGLRQMIADFVIRDRGRDFSGTRQFVLLDQRINREEVRRNDQKSRNAAGRQSIVRCLVDPGPGEANVACVPDAIQEIAIDQPAARAQVERFGERSFDTIPGQREIVHPHREYRLPARLVHDIARPEDKSFDRVP